MSFLEVNLVKEEPRIYLISKKVDCGKKLCYAPFITPQCGLVVVIIGMLIGLR